MSCNCKQVNEQVLAALGTIRQDVRSILALMGQGLEIVPEKGSEAAAEPSKEDMQRFLDDWRRKADEAWERELQVRRSAFGLETGNEVTLDDEARYLTGWGR